MLILIGRRDMIYNYKCITYCTECPKYQHHKTVNTSVFLDLVLINLMFTKFHKLSPTDVHSY